MLYFAFGSNLNVAQMRLRCPTSTVTGKAQLLDHALEFSGISRRWQGGGTCNITPSPGSSVLGVLYRLSPADFDVLDGFEGAPGRYRRREIEVNAGDDTIVAITYTRVVTPAMNPPSPAYAATVAYGYGLHGFALPPLLEAFIPR
jgi:gamma-glutamylcyclotransferase